MEDGLANNVICGFPDSTAILSFLHSDIVDLRRDEKLINALCVHVGNIAIIRRVLGQIDIVLSGVTEPEAGRKEALKANLKVEIKKFYMQDVDRCLEQLPHGIGITSSSNPEPTADGG